MQCVNGGSLEGHIFEDQIALSICPSLSVAALDVQVLKGDVFERAGQGAFQNDLAFTHNGNTCGYIEITHCIGARGDGNSVAGLSSRESSLQGLITLGADVGHIDRNRSHIIFCIQRGIVADRHSVRRADTNDVLSAGGCSQRCAILQRQSVIVQTHSALGRIGDGHSRIVHGDGGAVQAGFHIGNLHGGAVLDRDIGETNTANGLITLDRGVIHGDITAVDDVTHRIGIGNIAHHINRGVPDDQRAACGTVQDCIAIHSTSQAHITQSQLGSWRVQAEVAVGNKAGHDDITILDGGLAGQVGVAGQRHSLVVQVDHIAGQLVGSVLTAERHISQQLDGVACGSHSESIFQGLELHAVDLGHISNRGSVGISLTVEGDGLTLCDIRLDSVVAVDKYAAVNGHIFNSAVSKVKPTVAGKGAAVDGSLAAVICADHTATLALQFLSSEEVAAVDGDGAAGNIDQRIGGRRRADQLETAAFDGGSAGNADSAVHALNHDGGISRHVQGAGNADSHSEVTGVGDLAAVQGCSAAAGNIQSGGIVIAGSGGIAVFKVRRDPAAVHDEGGAGLVVHSVAAVAVDSSNLTSFQSQLAVVVNATGVDGAVLLSTGVSDGQIAIIGNCVDMIGSAAFAEHSVHSLAVQIQDHFLARGNGQGISQLDIALQNDGFTVLGSIHSLGQGGVGSLADLGNIVHELDAVLGEVLGRNRHVLTIVSNRNRVSSHQHGSVEHLRKLLGHRSGNRQAEGNVLAQLVDSNIIQLGSHIKDQLGGNLVIHGCTGQGDAQLVSFFGALDRIVVIHRIVLLNCVDDRILDFLIDFLALSAVEGDLFINVNGNIVLVFETADAAGLRVVAEIVTSRNGSRYTADFLATEGAAHDSIVRAISGTCCTNFILLDRFLRVIQADSPINRKFRSSHTRSFCSGMDVGLGCGQADISCISRREGDCKCTIRQGVFQIRRGTIAFADRIAPGNLLPHTLVSGNFNDVIRQVASTGILYTIVIPHGIINLVNRILLAQINDQPAFTHVSQCGRPVVTRAGIPIEKIRYGYATLISCTTCLGGKTRQLPGDDIGGLEQVHGGGLVVVTENTGIVPTERINIAAGCISNRIAAVAYRG